jgi:hypothetical protein
MFVFAQNARPYGHDIKREYVHLSTILIRLPWAIPPLTRIKKSAQTTISCPGRSKEVPA